MRKSLFVCLVMLAAISMERVSAASFQCCDLCGFGKGSLEFNLGYRTDEFEWRFKDNKVGSIFDLVALDGIAAVNGDAGNMVDLIDLAAGSTVGCLVESALGFDNTYKSQWKHMRMVNLGFEGRMETCCGIYLRARGNYGWVCEGKYEPRGFHLGSAEFFEGLFSDKAPSPRKRAKGHAWDISGGVGYNFKFCCDAFQIAPMVGWSYHNIDFCTDKYKSFTHFFGDVDFIEFLPEPLQLGDFGQFAWGGKSKADYCAHWTGPWVGFDSTYQCDCNWLFFCNFQYHYSRHCGDGCVKSFDGIFVSDEVIGDIDFEDFDTEDAFALIFAAKNKYHNKISMQGFLIGGGVNYTVNNCWYFGFRVDYWNMRKVRNDCSKLKTDAFFGVAIVDDNVEEVLFDEELELKRDLCLKTIRWESLRFEVSVGANF